jgi:hypothetical protein
LLHVALGADFRTSAVGISTRACFEAFSDFSSERLDKNKVVGRK